ncbi:farnesyl-diphosphate farnesyltransferase [Halobacteriales archaeon QS_8_69_26]|nr:MAG: farnesyl-diphosphate farnesyltransferase [Halobacteriales archaeon QS_8_69_26]
MNSRSEQSAEGTFEDDLEWCYDAVQGVSRTFAITIQELEEPMSRHICIGYLLCRVADTIEDAGHIPPEEQSRLLREYRAVLDTEDPTTVHEFRESVDPWVPPADDRTDDWEVVAQAARVVRTFESLDPGPREAARPPVRELVGGMAEFVDRYADEGGLRIETLDELEEYCWYAAGTVGTLVTNLVSRNASTDVTDTLRGNARAFALLLQLVNVAKDVADDYREEDNVYLPARWLREEGVDPENVTDPENVAAVARVIIEVTDHASGYLDGAQTWLEAMPEEDGNTLSAWAIPFLLAVGTIRELRERPDEVVEEGGVKVPREEVGALLERFATGVPRSALGDLRERIEHQPLHHYSNGQGM